MKSVASVAGLAAFVLGALADKTVTSCSTITEWATVYSTIDVCSTISTTVTPCGQCAPATVTAWTQPITSKTSSSYPTSTYCPTPGYYTECNCQVTQPKWIYYEQPCEVEYICPYVDWYYLNPKPVTVCVVVGGKTIGVPRTQTWHAGPTVIVKPTPVVTYIPNPTIIVINDITINVTAAPTYITYTTGVTTTVTTTTTVGPGPTDITDTDPGTPVSTFKLSATLNGEDSVVLQEGGSLVVAPATNDTTGGSFTLTSTGELMTADGGFVSLTFANGQAGPFTYGGKLRKRAIPDGIYFGVFSVGGGFGMSINGTGITIQVCGGNVLSGSDGLMGGCTQITLQAVPVDATFPSSAIPSSAAPSSAFSSAPPSSAFPSSAAPSGPSPSGSSLPTNFPSSLPSTAPISATVLPGSDLPSASPSVSLPLSSALPSSNLTNINGRRRAVRGMKFKYAA